MKQLPKLSEASEQRISSALTKVAELIDDGLTPNAAITKVASDEKFPAGQVRLMVRAFNTGRSLEHLRTHDTLEEKAASFELADASEVLERMFPSRFKTANEHHRDTAISRDYAAAPDAWLKRRDQANVAPMTKAASAPVAPYPEYPTRQAKQALAAVNTARRSAADARLDATKCAYAVISTMDKLAEYFRDPTGVPMCVAERSAVAVLGPRVKTLMAKVSTDKTVARRARQEKSASVLQPVDWNKAPYTLIKAALDAVDQFDAAQANLKDTEVAHSEKRAEVLRPFTGRIPTKPIYGSVWKDGSAKQAAVGGFARDTAAMALANTVADYAAKRMGANADRDELLNKSINELADPAHEDKLRAIRQQAMVHELIAGDPVISGYNYNDVINAHNHLSEVAPKAMQSRVMAQAMLRKYLESGQQMDMFDASQMLAANEGLNKRDMPEAMKGYQTGPMRSLGSPMPNRNIALPAETPPATLGAGIKKYPQAIEQLLGMGGGAPSPKKVEGKENA